MDRRVNRQKKEVRKEDVRERKDDIQRRYLLTYLLHGAKCFLRN